MKPSDISRFWSLVAKREPDACWLWTGGHSRGYGQTFRIDGVQLGSHRVAAFLAFGPRPDGAFVLHACDNPPCCNPRHLRYGTPHDNVKDAVERGRHVNPPVYTGPFEYVKGEEVWNAALTERKVREIWRLHLSGKNTAEIADSTKSPRDAVVDVCRGRTWRHLADAPSLEQLSKGGIRRPKMSDADVDRAKALIASGLTNRAIAAKLGVSPTPISNLRKHGTTWVPKP